MKGAATNAFFASSPRRTLLVRRKVVGNEARHILKRLLDALFLTL